MYEFSIAAKYLTPRWRQLSVSIISTISLLVIAAVVWLIVVFFSVSNGLTNSWIDKLIALTAPIRITPTQEYQSSYYHLIDSISINSDYSLKSIAEKLHTEKSDPYEPESDPELPIHWQAADRLEDGSLKDPVKLAFAALNDIPGVFAADYEMTVANLQLTLGGKKLPGQGQKTEGQLTHASYIGSLDPHNSKLTKALASITPQDLTNLLKNIAFEGAEYRDGTLEPIQRAPLEDFRSRLKAFFTYVTIEKLKPSPWGWQLPLNLLPKEAEWTAVATYTQSDTLMQLWVPFAAKDAQALLEKMQKKGLKASIVKLALTKEGAFLKPQGAKPKALEALPPLVLDDGVVLNAQVDVSSLDKAIDALKVLFQVNFSLQGTPLAGVVTLGSLHIESAKIETFTSDKAPYTPLWAYSDGSMMHLPTIKGIGDGVLLPKSFRDGGARLGDIGILSYYGLTASSLQEMQIPIYIAGFYDPGIIPIGGKYIIASRDITSLIRSAYARDEADGGNGINVRFNDYSQAERIKEQLQEKFEAAGISPYWKVETFKEYEFTKVIIQQLQSEKRLFTLLSIVIIIVACSNIISMLIILVNDKKVEIGILRSMGASSYSIGAIFGICGVIMGTVGSVIGTIAAIITLKNIQALVDFISRLQGHEMFSPVFYGETLPTELSFEALFFVIIATGLISLVAGIVPAVKASLLRPSAILKSE